MSQISYLKIPVKVRNLSELGRKSLPSTLHKTPPPAGQAVHLLSLSEGPPNRITEHYQSNSSSEYLTATTAAHLGVSAGTLSSSQPELCSSCYSARAICILTSHDYYQAHRSLILSSVHPMYFQAARYTMPGYREDVSFFSSMHHEAIKQLPARWTRNRAQSRHQTRAR